MNVIDIIMISISLAMDAFTVSICKSLSFPSKKYFIFYPISFSIFQVVMPYFGFLFGRLFSNSFSYLDHWISFLLLLYIGIQMIFSSSDYRDSFSFYSLSLPIILFFIGSITFLLCFIGCLLGYFFGNIFRNSHIFGGFLLIVTGFKILFEHIGLLSFL